MAKHGKEQNTQVREEQRRAAQSQNRKKFVKKVIGWSVAVVIVAFFIFWFASNTKVDTSNFTPLTFAIHERDHVIQGNSTNVLIEYSDFQCPACAQYQPVIKQFLEENPEVTFVYRHFPLKQIHKNAVSAAIAAEAAANQGKFFEMHDMLFERQNEWSNNGLPKSYFVGLAEELGLDVDTFEKDLSDPELASWVEFNYESAIKFNLRGTPSFFLNGQLIQFSSLDELEARLK